MDADYHFVYVAEGSVAASDGVTAKAGDLIQIEKNGRLELDGEGELVEIRVDVSEYHDRQPAA
jgi:hypothetical protein